MPGRRRRAIGASQSLTTPSSSGTAHGPPRRARPQISNAVGDHVLRPDGDGTELELTLDQAAPPAALMGRGIRRYVALEAGGLRRGAERPDPAG